VDAVLPADLGGAPHANRQHTKACPSMRQSYTREGGWRDDAD
jgi:hypothetical protein